MFYKEHGYQLFLLIILVFVLFLFFSAEAGFSGFPGTHSVEQDGLKLRSVCLCLRNAGIKGVRHHC